jgi:hypothetical protein
MLASTWISKQLSEDGLCCEAATRINADMQRLLSMDKLEREDHHYCHPNIIFLTFGLKECTTNKE